MADPYKTLGVGRLASADEIKKAYRKLAKKLHPDVNPGDKKIETQFKEAASAYDMLSDPEKRRRFDRGEIDEQGNPRHPGFSSGAPWGTAGGATAGGGAGPRGRSARDFGLDENESDEIFKDFFGFGRGRGGLKMRGADVTYRLEVEFLDAALGGKKRLSLADGKSLDVTLPPGTEDGQQLRLKGQGMPGQGGAPNGDAFVEVAVRAHAFFEREGADILLECPISLGEAILGATIEVPTIDGRVSLKVPAGSNSGTQLRLKGKGIASQKAKARGDQYVRFVVTLPASIDADLEAAVKAWSKAHPHSVRGRFDGK